MKKIIIGLFLSLVIFVSPAFTAVSLANTNLVEENLKSVTETLTKILLDKLSVTTKEINFDVGENILTLKGIKAKPSFLPGSLVEIDEMILVAPNIAALDAKTEGRPLVAEKIIYKNYVATYKTQNTDQTVLIESSIINNWKQNIGRVIELSAQGYNEAFFEAVLDISIDSIETINQKSYTEIENSEGLKVIIEKYTSTTTKDITSSKVGAIIIEDIDYTEQMPNGDKVMSRVEKLTWNSFGLPSPKFFASIMTFLPNILDDTMTDAQVQELLPFVLQALGIYGNAEIILEQLNVKEQKETEIDEILSLQNFRFLSDFDVANQAAAKLSIIVDGVEFDSDQLMLSPQEQAMVQEFLGDVINFDTSFNIDLATNQKPSSLDISFGVQNVGHQNIELNVILPDEVLPRLFALTSFSGLSITEADLQKWLLETQLVSAHARYKDSSLLSMLLVLMSEETGLSLEAALEMIEQQVSSTIATSLPALSADFSEPILQCINQPNELKISSELANPMKLELVLVTFLIDPASLNISATCVPGESILTNANLLKSKLENIKIKGTGE